MSWTANLKSIVGDLIEKKYENIKDLGNRSIVRFPLKNMKKVRRLLQETNHEFDESEKDIDGGASVETCIHKPKKNYKLYISVSVISILFILLLALIFFYK